MLLSDEFAGEYKDILADTDPKRRTDRLLGAAREGVGERGLLMLSMKGSKADLDGVAHEGRRPRRTLGDPEQDD